MYAYHYLAVIMGTEYDGIIRTDKPVVDEIDYQYLKRKIMFELRPMGKNNPKQVIIKSLSLLQGFDY